MRMKMGEHLWLHKMFTANFQRLHPHAASVKKHHPRVWGPVTIGQRSALFLFFLRKMWTSFLIFKKKIVDERRNIFNLILKMVHKVGKLLFRVFFMAVKGDYAIFWSFICLFI